MNNVQTVAEIFAGKLLQIPDYQRGYAWDEQNWDDFLEDLDLLEPGKDHYTGTLVYYRTIPGAARTRHGQHFTVAPLSRTASSVASRRTRCGKLLLHAALSFGCHLSITGLLAIANHSQTR